jgi:hypothetical protein
MAGADRPRSESDPGDQCEEDADRDRPPDPNLAPAPVPARA